MPARTRVAKLSRKLVVLEGSNENTIHQLARPSDVSCEVPERIRYQVELEGEQDLFCFTYPPRHPQPIGTRFKRFFSSSSHSSILFL